MQTLEQTSAADRKKRLGEFLRHLRNTREYGVSAVADYLEISEADLSAIEKSEKMPKLSMLTALAALYRIPVNTFRMFTDKGAHLMYRSAAGAELDEFYRYEIEAYIENILEISRRWEKSRTRMSFTPYCGDLKGKDLNAIGNAALLLRGILGFEPTGRIDLIRTLEQKGFLIIFTMLPRDVRGVTYLRNRTFLFFINKTDHKRKQKFSIAHEFGHIMLHGKTDFNHLSEAEKIVVEDISDIFANMFLLPRYDIESMDLTYADICQLGKVTQIAKDYDVSIKTVYHACRNAGIINDDQLKELREEYDRLKIKPDREASYESDGYHRMLDHALQYDRINVAEYDYMRGYC